MLVPPSLSDHGTLVSPYLSNHGKLVPPSLSHIVPSFSAHNRLVILVVARCLDGPFL